MRYKLFNGNRRQFVCVVDEEEMNTFKEICISLKTPMSDIVRNLIREFISKHKIYRDREQPASLLQ